MRSENQSFSSQLRRLRQGARTLLTRYDIRSPRLTLLNYHHNAIFRVNDADGNRYILRLQFVNPQQLARLNAEIDWLVAIRSQTDLTVSEPIATDSGVYVTTIVDAAGVSAWTGALFRWMPGRPLALPIARGTFGRIGRFTARLHDYGAQRADFLTRCRPVWDWDGIFGAVSDDRSTSPASYLISEQQSLLRDIAVLSKSVMRSLDDQPGQFGMIHGDLHLGNCLLHGRSVVAIDFEDCGPGYFLMDMATTLREICHPLKSPQLYARVCDEYLTAYSDIRPVPQGIERHLVAFSAVRLVFVANWLMQLLDQPVERQANARSLLLDVFTDLACHHAALSHSL